MHLSTSPNDSILVTDASSLHSQIDDLKLELRTSKCDMLQKCTEIKLAEDKIIKYNENLKKYKQTIISLEDKYSNSECINKSLNVQIHMLKSENKLIDSYKKEIELLKSDQIKYEHIQIVLSSTVTEVDEMLKNQIMSKNELATMVITLKRELQANERKKYEIRNALRSSQYDNRKHLEEIRELKNKISTLESDNYNLFNNEPDNKQSQNAAANIQSPSLSPKISRKSISLIELCDSPYLQIKSSSIGLSPIIRSRNGSNKNTLKRLQSEETENKFSILNKKPKLLTKSNSDLRLKNMVFDGLGGSQKVDNLTNNPLSYQVQTTKDRLRKGALRKLT